MADIVTTVGLDDARFRRGLRDMVTAAERGGVRMDRAFAFGKRALGVFIGGTVWGAARREISQFNARFDDFFKSIDEHRPEVERLRVAFDLLLKSISGPVEREGPGFLHILTKIGASAIGQPGLADAIFANAQGMGKAILDEAKIAQDAFDTKNVVEAQRRLQEEVAKLSTQGLQREMLEADQQHKRNLERIGELKTKDSKRIQDMIDLEKKRHQLFIDNMMQEGMHWVVEDATLSEIRGLPGPMGAAIGGTTRKRAPKPDPFHVPDEVRKAMTAHERMVKFILADPVYKPESKALFIEQEKARFEKELRGMVGGPGEDPRLLDELKKHTEKLERLIQKAEGKARFN